MKIKRFVSFVRDAIKDPQREFSERVFLILTLISELVLPIALLGDILTGENPWEIGLIAAIVVAVPIITFVCLYRDMLWFAIRSIVTALVLVILPALFFFGGGLEGGGYLWFIFAFMYVGLVLSGRWRRVVLVLVFAVTLICYLVAYYYPELVCRHERPLFFADTFISIVLVGMVCFVMTWAQNLLFKDENARAKKEAEKAEELARSQNRFFSSMSHEIRTPINSILGLNELILRDPDASDEIIRDAGGIQGAGKLLLALINDILDFSKMEAGSMDIVPVDYRVGDMISEIVSMIWLKAKDKGLKFDVSVDPKVPSVLYGDEVRIKQVIINLLNNAVKYTADGSVELHIENLETDDKKTVLSIAISDTGMGIKKDALPYLFDAFKRVDQEKNRYIEGTGLGLSIVKQLVELMEGQITVNSVYGEGSTFMVTVRQGISDLTPIGELSIHNQQVAKRKKYESSFKAPDAKILIVDDNEMNLEVERKLLADTELGIDTVMSGKQALQFSVNTRYDVILMDHLMPEMDGIECLKQLRNQVGGLNRTTPVVVLTANAGSDLRELYNRSGFDGYLVKPVSGESLEDTLVRHIPKEKLVLSGKMLRMQEDISATAGYARKASVLITSTSMCDLPHTIVRSLNLHILPFMIRTEEGVFQDGVQIDANELVRYISDGKNAESMPPDVGTYTEFFSGVLKKAHHLIHIALTTSMSTDYRVASEAAKSFDNVTVVNSACISSSTGILVMIACKLAQKNMPVDEIVSELEVVKQRLHCSFIIDTTEYMARKGLISAKADKIARALSLHPCLEIRDDRSGVGGVWIGSTKRAYRQYIRRAFPVDIIPDSDVVFVTYVDVPMETLLWIKDEISRIVYFEHVVFKKASAAISANCGPGTFGILYFVKSNKSYNIGSLIDEHEDILEQETEAREDEAPDGASAEAGAAGGALEQKGQEQKEEKWYDQLEGIDGEIAVQNSGSEETLQTMLKIFYDSAPAKSKELETFYAVEDWSNYTIKIHALKSSAKLIGAMALSDLAQSLEMAGKDGDIGYIRENHSVFMEDYVRMQGVLKEYLVGEEEESEEEKPVAEQWLLDGVFEGLEEAADDMDSDAIKEILEELDGYAIPESDRDLFAEIIEKSENYDYDGLLEVLQNRGGSV